MPLDRTMMNLLSQAETRVGLKPLDKVEKDLMPLDDTNTDLRPKQEYKITWTWSPLNKIT